MNPHGQCQSPTGRATHVSPAPRLAFRALPAFLPLVLLLAAPLHAQNSGASAAGSTSGAGSTTTNHVTAPAPVVEPTLPATNAPAATNAIAVPPPGRSSVPVRGMFLASGQGKFSVSGRVLKLPAEPAEADTVPATAWHRSIDFGMNLTKGNSDTLRYSLAFDAVRERDDDLVRLRAQAMYGESDNTKDTENASARARYERRLSPRTYGLGYADWLTDTIADTDYRVTAILSPGWHLIRTERTVLNVEAGAGYLEEKKSDTEDGFAAGRLAASAERLLNAHVLAWCAAEYLPKFADTSVFFVNAETGIASMLARNLSLHLTLSDRYDNAPAIGRDKNDLQLNAALSLNF